MNGTVRLFFVIAKNIGIAFLLLIFAGLLSRGDSKEEAEAKRLGFASVGEMERIHEEGWHTKVQYVADETARAERSGFADIDEMRQADAVGAANKREYDRYLRDRERGGERAKARSEQDDFYQARSQSAQSFYAADLVPTQGDQTKEKVATTYDCWAAVNFAAIHFNRPEYRGDLTQSRLNDIIRARSFWNAEVEAMRSFFVAENSRYYMNYALEVSTAIANLTGTITEESPQFQPWRMWATGVARDCILYMDVGDPNQNSWQSFL